VRNSSRKRTIRTLEIEVAEGVHFKRWWADTKTGDVFCLAEGPSKEAVRRVHKKAGHPTDEIYEVTLSGE
jgi:hypothetical protein